MGTMAFNNRPSRDTAPSDPAHLYRILATQNAEASENLWYHQGEILNTWNSKHRNDPDVALELPTGAGKTLVGPAFASRRDPSRGAAGGPGPGR